jgi:hypothetical protein
MSDCKWQTNIYVRQNRKEFGEISSVGKYNMQPSTSQVPWFFFNFTSDGKEIYISFLKTEAKCPPETLLSTRKFTQVPIGQVTSPCPTPLL